MTDAESRYGLLPADEQTPERLYEKQWVLTLLENVIGRLRAEFEGDDRSSAFELFKPFLAGEEGRGAYRQVAALGQMTEAAARVAVHRMRRRYRQLLHEEISETLDRPQDVDEEIRYLLRVLVGV